jgi:hypothetical protein
VGRFLGARFLADYATDAGVVKRLGQVLHRARQTLEPRGAAALERGLPAIRDLVRARLDDLTLAPRDAVLRALA